MRGGAQGLVREDLECHPRPCCGPNTQPQPPDQQVHAGPGKRHARQHHHVVGGDGGQERAEDCPGYGVEEEQQVGAADDGATKREPHVILQPSTPQVYPVVRVAPQIPDVAGGVARAATTRDDRVEVGRERPRKNDGDEAGHGQYHQHLDADASPTVCGGWRWRHGGGHQRCDLAGIPAKAAASRSRSASGE